MNNYQTQVIQAQINLLWHIRETHENDLTTNQVSWIDDDIIYVEVKYLTLPDDSTRADEFREEEPKTISFLNALELLTVRLHNTIEYLENILDRKQSTSAAISEKGTEVNIKFSYLYRDYANFKNYNELIFSNPNGTSLADIKAIIHSKLISEEWFYASKWNVKDLHFPKWDDEIDHTYHEFESVEYTDEIPTEKITIDEFLQRISS